MKYLVATGWWACQRSVDTRDELIGSDDLREAEFHALWLQLVKKYTNYEEIVVIDSASPMLPEKDKDEVWITLRKNFGHSTNHETKLCGVSRSFLMSLMYAYVNDYDYWVYIEQDAVIYGEGIVEKAIEACESGIIWGAGKNTPQPVQQSFMVFAKERIPEFIYQYEKIRATDFEISPEWKFWFAANRIAKYLPVSFLKLLSKNQSGKFKKSAQKVGLRLLYWFNDFNELPFGYGRVRPVCFDDEHFYFQHGNSDELNFFLKKMNNFYKENDCI